MDFFDERVLATLKDGKPKSFGTLLSEVSFSHNTLQQHLERLTAKGLVVREKLAATGFGRPKFAYHVPLRTSKQVTAALEDPAMELVAIPFSRLRHVCRFEKGGYCKETRKGCTPQICRQIRK
jgi:DNA-binding Lrp family transcriptional regulator